MTGPTRTSSSERGSLPLPSSNGTSHHDLGGGLRVEALELGPHQSLGHARVALLVIGIHCNIKKSDKAP